MGRKGLMAGSDALYRCEFVEVYNEQIRDLLAPVGTLHVGQKTNSMIHPWLLIRNSGQPVKGRMHF